MSAIVTPLVCRVVPILLLHGQPGRGRDWQPLVAAIHNGARASGLEPPEVLAIDRPGWDGVSAAGGFEASAEAALAALDHACLQRATVVGHSYGAGVASWLATRHPDRVEALVLVAPSANTASLIAVDHLLGWPVLGYAASAALMSCVRLAIGSRPIRGRLSSHLGVDSEWLRGAGEWLRGPDVRRSFFIEQRHQLRELPLLERRLGSVSAPTTIVMGTRDEIVPLRSARLLASQIPGAELIEVEGGRHMLPAQVPARLAEIILAMRIAPELIEAPER